MSGHQKPIFEKPFALLMGPQRAGTTWVDRYLRSRGDVCLPEEVKEVFFFDRNFDRGIDFYKSHFTVKPEHHILMEITATSFDCADAPQRVYDLFGDNITLICPLRHPIVRSYSLYLHYLRYGIVNGTLGDAIAQEPQIIKSSYYAEHLLRWIDLFGADKIQFLFQEELEDNQEQYVIHLCQALNLPHIKPSDDVKGRYNVTTFSKFGPLASTAQRIADLLRSYKLYAIINFAKKLGLKKLIFGKERPETQKTSIPEDDLIILNRELGQEIEKLEGLLGISLDQWQNDALMRNI